MQATGITKMIDDLGRIVIPKPMREKMGITHKSILHLWMKDGKIHMRKHVKGEEVEGFINELDDLGRIKLTSLMGLAKLVIKDTVEIILDESTGVIMLMKHDNCCSLCGSLEDIKPFRERYICKKCAKAIAETLSTLEA